MSTVADEPKIRNGRREPEVRAKPCKHCGSTATRVVRSMLIVRYCKCLKCGYRWTQTPMGTQK